MAQSAVEVLAQHRWKLGADMYEAACTGCQWTRRIANTQRTGVELHTVHQLEELTQAGHAIVELSDPLPAGTWAYQNCLAMWNEFVAEDGQSAANVAAFPGLVEFDGARYEPLTAREIVAAMLGAVVVAENGTV